MNVNIRRYIYRFKVISCGIKPRIYNNTLSCRLYMKLRSRTTTFFILHPSSSILHSIIKCTDERCLTTICKQQCKRSTTAISTQSKLAPSLSFYKVSIVGQHALNKSYCCIMLVRTTRHITELNQSYQHVLPNTVILMPSGPSRLKYAKLVEIEPVP